MIENDNRKKEYEANKNHSSAEYSTKNTGLLSDDKSVQVENYPVARFFNIVSLLSRAIYQRKFDFTTTCCLLACSK